ncbi:MAG TPA: acyl-CoA dehydrogenase family protein [Candidatus Competibacteraceae bacterium]|nr:acyl-CoA dehydrogenase family protein [Candidatus Competibacteraceae bacterium]
MDFDFSDDELALTESARQVAQEVLAPRARAYDESAEFCRANLDELARLGFWGLNLPERYGGIDASSIAISLIIEQVSGACAATASSLTAHFLATDSILIGGSEEQRREWLPRAADGRVLGSFGLTEPGAGSNPVEMSTRAVREGDGWRLSGVKHYITNGGEADFVVVYAKTDPSAGHRGISAFLVPRGTPGMQAARPEPTMGLKASHIFELSFDCWLPAAALLGQEGQGFKTAMAVLDRGRVEVAAMAVGISQAALDATVAWVKERRIGGQALGDYQGVQWMLADMHAQLEAARLLTYKAAQLRDSGGRFSTESAVAKLVASEAAAKITDSALQLHGGYGYTRALPLERYVRDARILRIFEGASEVQRMIIARSLLR